MISFCFRQKKKILFTTGRYAVHTGEPGLMLGKIKIARYNKQIKF